MNAHELITLIREAGASSDDGVMATLEDSEALALLFGLEPLDPNSGVSVATHDEAQGIVEEAHGFVAKGIRLDGLKKAAKLPEVATVAGYTVNLNWQKNFHLDGWFAEIDPEIVRELGDKMVSMVVVEEELARYGDSARYVKDSFGETYLCIYKDAV